MVYKYSPRKYFTLNDKELLNELYINNGLSTLSISIVLECPNTAVLKALHRHNIPVRSRASSRLIKDHDLHIVDNIIKGCLLGDAGVKCKFPHSSIANTCFYKGNKFKDHIEYIAKQFYPQNYDEFIKYSPSFIDDKEYPHYRFRTYSHKELNDYYKTWYPKSNNFKKLVPRNLKLNPEIVLHWFLDDGCASYTKKKHKWFVNIIFSSESFSKEDNEFLVDQLNKLADVHAFISKTNSGTGWRIKIGASHIHKFYNLIGPPIIPSLAYKWKEHLSDRVDPRDTLQYKHVDLLQ